MRNLALIFILLFTTQTFAEDAFVSVCDRHPAVRDRLVEILKARCEEILPIRLSSIGSFEVRAKVSELSASDFKDLYLFRLFLENTDDELGEFPTDLFKYTPHLNMFSMRNANFARLPNQTFAAASKLVNIEIENSHVGTLSPEFFALWPRLTQLKVPANSLLDKHYPTFKNLAALEITDGSLSHLSKIFFSSFKSIITLGLTRVSLAGTPYDLFSSMENLSEFFLKDTILKPFADGQVAWPARLTILFINFEKAAAELPKGLFDQPDLVIRRVLLNSATGIVHIPDNLFIHIKGLEEVDVTGSRLSLTSKGAFAGVPKVFGLPVNFGVADVGGSSQEWAP